MAGNESDHEEDNRRQEAEHGNGLKNVEDRDHPGLDARIVGRDISVCDGEDQTEQVRQPNSHDGVKGVDRQRADGVRDFNNRRRLAEPVLAGADNCEENGQGACGYGGVNNDGPGASRYQRAGKCVLDVHSPSPAGEIPSSRASGIIKRRRAALKSNSSA